MSEENELESVQEMTAALEKAVADAGGYIEQCVVDHETRHCIWPGQSDDGKKHKEALGREAFPWEGASDARIRLVDEVINDSVRLLRAAVKRMTPQAGPVESNDTVKSAALTTFLQWLVHGKMRRNLRRELPLLANWQETYGKAFLAITWDEERRIRKRVVTLDELGAAAKEAMQADGRDGELALRMINAIFDETLEEEVATWLQTLFKDLKPRQARRCVRDLRETAQCTVPEERVVRSQPVWTACRAFKDIFFPANCTDLQSSPWVAWRDVLTPQHLRGRILTDDYDPARVDEATETGKGKSVLDNVRLDPARVKAATIDEMEGMIEVFSFYRHVVDDEGYAKIEVTEFCPFLEEPFAEYEMDYPRPQYPFVEFTRDRTERNIVENRSVPELAETQQSIVKTQYDFRTDRTSISILPPVRVPVTRGATPLKFGPAVQVPERRPGEISWMQPPSADAETINVEQQARRDLDNYFGRLSEEVNPARQTLYQQAAVDDWLGGLSEAIDQTVWLCRRYMSDEEFARITGVPLPFAIEEGKEDDWEEYDILLDFNAADLNMEYVLKKLEVIQKALLPADTVGVIDRAGLIKWGMQTVDPILATKFVRDIDTATNQEVEDEQLQFAKIAAGTEPEMKEGGQNFALRAQVLRKIIEDNPAVKQRYEQDEIFRKMMDARLQHLEFQVQQQQNAQIGRVGAMPALGQTA